MTIDQANAAMLAAIRGDEDPPEGLTREQYAAIVADVDEARANGLELLPLNNWSGGDGA